MALRQGYSLMPDGTRTWAGEPERLPVVLMALFSDLYDSSTGAKQACRRRQVLVNGAYGGVDTVVAPGQTVSLVERTSVVGIKLTGPGLEAVYEDDHMAVVVKPQGMPTQGKGQGTLQGRIKYCLAPSHVPGLLPRPHHVHRLDAPTGGLVMVAKSRPAMVTLSDALTQHRVTKRYEALLLGRMEGAGTVDAPLEGRPAVTHFQVLGHAVSPEAGPITLVALWLQTGRTHQLRKHCAMLAHPILGDRKYWRRRLKQGEQLQLLPGPGARQAWHEQQELWRAQQPEQQPPGPSTPSHTGGGSVAQGQQSGASACNTQPASTSAARSVSSGDEGEGGCEHDCPSGDAAAVGGGDTGAEAGGAADGEGLGADLCLWAVELQLGHPVTGRQLRLSIDHHAANSGWARHLAGGVVAAAG